MSQKIIAFLERWTIWGRLKKLRFSVGSLVLISLMIGTGALFYRRLDVWGTERIFPSETTYSAEESPDTQYIITGSFDKTVKLWDAKTGAVAKTFPVHTGYVYCATLSPDGKHIASTDGSTLRVFDSETAATILVISPAYCDKIQFLSDGKRIFASGNSPPSILDTTTGTTVLQLKSKDSIHAATLSANERFVLTSSSSGSVGVWDAATGKEIFESKSILADGKVIVCSPDGKTGAASWHNYIQLFELQINGELKRLHSINSGRDFCHSLAFSPDGKRLLACQNGEFQLYDIDSRGLLSHQQKSGMESARFMKDGKRILVAGYGSTRIMSQRREDSTWGILSLPELWVLVLLYTAWARNMAIDNNTKAWRVACYGATPVFEVCIIVFFLRTLNIL